MTRTYQAGVAHLKSTWYYFTVGEYALLERQTTAVDTYAHASHILHSSHHTLRVQHYRPATDEAGEHNSRFVLYVKLQHITCARTCPKCQPTIILGWPLATRVDSLPRIPSHHRPSISEIQELAGKAIENQQVFFTSYEEFVLE